MARVGIQILEGDRTSRNQGSEYAFLAAVTGLVCIGQNERARELMAQGTRTWLRPESAKTELAYLYGRVTQPSRAGPCAR